MIPILTQEALKAYLDSVAIEGLNVYQGITNDYEIGNTDRTPSITLPAVIAQCNEADHDDDNRGNWWASARVLLRLHANDTTAATVKTRSNQLSAAFELTNIAPLITAACAAAATPVVYTAFGVTIQKAGYRIDGKVWELFLNMRIYCCASVIS